jgi:SH3-like domain-containing protein
MAWRYLFAAILAACPRGAAQAVEFPYVAYVNSADVYVRSGPGRDYYPTDKLQKGEKVEVYRHDPGGWLAIRPPRQSFSWVSTRHLDPTEDRLAVVNSSRVVARVGSTFSDVRDVIQVRLEKGEQVALVDSPASDSPWCKIAPPAGEFRWVFSKFVDSELPEDVARDEREAAGESDLADEASDQRGGVRLASGAQKADREPRVAIRQARPADITNESGRQRELDRIDLELSAMVVDEISTWSFGSLYERANTLLAQAQTPAERGRARQLVDKLARFEDIKKRHDAIRHPEATAVAGSGGGGVAPAPRAVVDPRFDGVGRLAPVVSQRPGAPQFALIDASNTVVSFITPAPGVNLRPYVDKQVGVNGQRGYRTDLQREHINVQHVTLVDVQRR